MVISTNDSILKFGTQDEVTSGTPAAAANNIFSKADQGASVNWTNGEDAPLGSAVLECTFATKATQGTVGLYARLFDMNSDGDDTNVPDADYPQIFVGSFVVDHNVANATAQRIIIPLFDMPSVESGQRIDWYIKNDSTSQTINASWRLWITPRTEGPAA